jgi:ATP-dependent Clp protease adaptor protein ClpS
MFQLLAFGRCRRTARIVNSSRRADCSGFMDDRRQKGSEADRGVAVEEARPKLKRPPLYRVVLLNDDYTPMEFVVQILQKVFSMDRSNATRIMLEVHTKGKGICGVYTYEIAETKVAQVTGLAQQHQHPLLCTMEET